MREVKRLTPWLRVVLITCVLCNDRNEAARRLGISYRRIRDDISKVYYLTNTRTPWHAALRLGILRINYDEIPDFLAVDEVALAPGISILIEPYSASGSFVWRRDRPFEMLTPESRQPDPSESPAS